MKYREPKIIKEKKEKREAKATFWRIFFIEGFLFLLTFVITILSALKLSKTAQLKEIYLLYFLIAIIALTFFVYRKEKKFKKIVYKILFSLVVFCGGMTILSLFLPIFGAVLTMGILMWFWFELPSISIHNILIIFGVSGLASFWGINFSVSLIVGLLLFCSLFTFWSIYKNNYIFLIFQEMVDSRAIIGFIVPRKMKFFEEDFNKTKIDSNCKILGGVEIFLPGLLVASMASYGVLNLIVVTIFSLVGLFFSHWLSFSHKDDSMPIPALLPIALFSMLGYLMTLLI